MSVTTSPRVAPVALMVCCPSASLASTVGRLNVTGMEGLQLSKSWRDDRRLGEGAGQRLDGLESVSGDAEDDLVVRTDSSRFRERERTCDGGAAGRLGEDPARLG